MKFKDNNFSEPIFNYAQTIEDVTFYFHPKKGGKFGYYLDISEKDEKALVKILKKNNVKFEIQRGGKLPF